MLKKHAGPKWCCMPWIDQEPRRRKRIAFGQAVVPFHDTMAPVRITEAHNAA